MTVIFDAACAGRVAPLRLVMLPAAYAAPEDFVRSGFIAAVRERRDASGHRHLSEGHGQPA